jgi:hypothetical protein
MTNDGLLVNARKRAVSRISGNMVLVVSPTYSLMAVRFWRFAPLMDV